MICSYIVQLENGHVATRHCWFLKRDIPDVQAGNKELSVGDGSGVADEVVIDPVVAQAEVRGPKPGLPGVQTRAMKRKAARVTHWEFSCSRGQTLSRAGE